MKATIFPRENYLSKLRPFYESADLIKVVTGIRRCGKSSLLLSVMAELQGQGVDSHDIIYLNLDAYGYTSVRTPEQLERLIAASMSDDHFKYLFIDEIQNVEGFETLLNAYRESGRFSIFITGFNSYLLSGELVTKLTGRYIEVPIFPLSFSESWQMETFLGIKHAESLQSRFTNYLRVGGFPRLLTIEEETAKWTYLENLVEQIIQKDVKRRVQIRNRAVFDKVRHYFVNNFGTPISLKNVAEELKRTENLVVKTETLKRYLNILEDARILYKCPRFDLKSRRSLAGEGKYYLADTSLYFATNTDQRINYGPVLENILFLHLRSRGYEVSVGKIGNLECDFIARKAGNYFYVQVAMTIMNDPKTEEREYRALEAIRDNYPKYLFTLDTLLQKRNGIHHLNIVDFLTGTGEL